MSEFNSKSLPMNKYRLIICFCLISISAYPNFQEYKVFNESIEKLELLGYDKPVIKHNYIKFVSILNEAFGLNLNVDYAKNKILITGPDFSTKFKNIGSQKANSVLTHMRPEIEKKLEYYYLTIGYEEYLSDMMLSITDSESRFRYDLNYFDAPPECRKTLTFSRDSSFENLIIHSVVSMDIVEFFKKGDTIVSINTAPAIMIPNGLAEMLLETSGNTLGIRRNNKVVKRKLGCLTTEKKRYFSIDTTNSDYLRIKVNQLDWNFSEKLLDSLTFYPDTSRKLILDFTECGGGLLKEVVNLADCFIDTKKLILKVVPEVRLNFAAREFFSTPGATIKRDIYAILISQTTASGAEAIVAALKHYDLVKYVVGEETAGHGIVQKFFSYQSNMNVGCRFTMGYIVMPDGQTIHNNAIVPPFKALDELN